MLVGKVYLYLEARTGELAQSIKFSDKVGFLNNNKIYKKDSSHDNNYVDSLSNIASNSKYL